MPTTLLVDGNAVSYTINVNQCNNEKDFCKFFFSRLREYSKQFQSMPKAIIFFDDKWGGNWREEIYPDYQKSRKEAKNKYTEQQLEESKLRSKYLNCLKEKIDASNRCIYLHFPKTETDDLISLYCNNIQKEGETVIILTTDKDLFQLIRDKGKKKVQVLFLIKRKLVKDEKLGQEVLKKKIWLGDPSDSIPGVCKNVGEHSLNDLKVFLHKIKNWNKEAVTPVDFTDVKSIKKVCESINVKYIPSFSNFSLEQLKLNKKLIDLNYVVLKDKEEGNIKTNYLKENIEKAKISPFALYSI